MVQKKVCHCYPQIKMMISQEQNNRQELVEANVNHWSKEFKLAHMRAKREEARLKADPAATREMAEMAQLEKEVDEVMGKYHKWLDKEMDGELEAVIGADRVMDPLNEVLIFRIFFFL